MIDIRSTLLLLSGGIDSPVAGYMMKRKGYAVEAIHYTYEPASDNSTEEKCITLCRILGIPRLYVVPAGIILGRISKLCNPRFYFILSKRVMYRLASMVAGDRFDCLTTGESLSQVSSQTLKNLAIIDSAVRHPVIRPLLCMDKVEIIRIAERIGTYKVSLGPELCNMFGPEHPATTAKLDYVLAEEEKIDLASIRTHLQNTLRVHTITSQD